MAMINCAECGRDVSDKASACPGCGAPVAGVVTSPEPTRVRYDRKSGLFEGTKPLMAKLAMKAVQALSWKIDQVNETLGLVTFQTGMSWGSFSGVSCSLSIDEVSEHQFRVSGTGKQNVSGGQMFALNIGNEAQGKANKAIEKMRELAAHG